MSHEPNPLALPSVLQAYTGVTPGATPTLIAHIYPDGDQWGVMIGKNGQDGFCGYAPTLSEALCDLGAEIRRAEYLTDILPLPTNKLN